MPQLSLDSYDFLAPPRIVFGWGRWREVGPLAAALGSRAFLVWGSRTLVKSGLVNQLQETLRRIASSRSIWPAFRASPKWPMSMKSSGGCALGVPVPAIC